MIILVVSLISFELIRNKNLPDKGVVKFINRKDWNAKEPIGNISQLKLPVNRIIISHTSTRKCEKEVK